jgi:formylmethanofuran dehydrogenase subunit C
MELELTNTVDNLCDYTYNFTWQEQKLRPGDIIPSQKDTDFTFGNLVDELKKQKDVRISGNAGKRLGYSMGVGLKHFGGKGKPEKAGTIYVEGNVSPEMGMGMAAGTIYVKGSIEEPVGNVVEVVSDEEGFRKFRSITDILCNGLGKDELSGNSFDRKKKHLLLDDRMLRGTVAARCDCDSLITVEGDVYNGTGLLMTKGTVHVTGDAGMNTGAHLDGGMVVVEGLAGEFAGAYMKKGTIILEDAKGFAGANLEDGIIYARKSIRTSKPVEELGMSEDDGKVIMKHLGIRQVEAMSYHKYGIQKERLFRMRDGSFMLRKIE